MEKQTEQKQGPTNASSLSQTEKNTEKLTITAREAEEYCAYKRQKKIAEIMAAVSRSSTELKDGEDAHRICERAAKLRQAAVKMRPSKLVRHADCLIRHAVPVDCIIGGTGETLAKVKAYEAKTAQRLHARELTVILTPSLIADCRYAEIKKELKRIGRAAKKATIKVWVDKSFPFGTLARVARICSEMGAKFFCVPYFAGCERLRLELTCGCELEVGEVSTLDEFRMLTDAGVGRIVTDRIWDIYSEWMREAQKIVFPAKKEIAAPEEERKEDADTPKKASALATLSAAPAMPTTVERAAKLLPSLSTAEKKVNPETDYRCRLEGKDLKFL